jgi:hypothetical protein
MSSANPYTATLLDGLPSRDLDLAAFVAHWDRVESLVIDVFRRAEATAADESEWRYLRTWLSRQSWALAEPFTLLLHNPRAAAFVGNRVALTALPDARAALNGRLLAEWQRCTNPTGGAGT